MRRGMHLAPALLALAALLALSPLPGRFRAEATGPDKTPGDQVQYLSGVPMFLAAQDLGITQIQGKDITRPTDPRGNARAKKLKDVGIGTSPVDENEPSVVANPVDKRFLVAGSHLFPAPGGVRCAAYTSSDGGATWSAPSLVPQLPGGQCSDPVLAYNADGTRVYYAHMDIKFEPFDWDIVVSSSTDNGASWSAPVVALDGAANVFIYDKPWIGTAPDDASSVYVTATQFEISAVFGCNVAFARSTNGSASYGPPTILDSSGGSCGAPTVVQGSRPAGGPSGGVIVAWYNSGVDGWLAGSFKIRVSVSSDNGATFGSPRDASIDAFEAPFYLGPFFAYHRWWAVMFPDVELDGGGTAHIVYARDPESGSATNEDGDIRYVTSAAPYTSWAPPVTVSDDTSGRAQGFAALEIQHTTGQSGTLSVIWEDHRLSPVVPTAFPDSSNLFYDIFYSRKVPGRGAGWTPNFRVSDTPSISDYFFVGDYIDLAANNKLFGVWTDRRHEISIFALEDNVFGSAIIPGGGAP